MVSLVWYILSLCHICAFGWQPVLLDFVLLSVLIGFRSVEHPAMWRMAMGGAVFAFLKLFFGLTVSGWWLLAACPVAALLPVLPGGFTLALLLLKHLEVISLPVWGLIVCLVVDSVLLSFTLLDWFAEYKEEDGQKLSELKIRQTEKKTTAKIIAAVAVVVIPLILLAVVILGAIAAKTVMFIGILAILAYLKLLLYAILQLLTPYEAPVENGLSDGMVACYDLGGTVETVSSFTVAGKLQRIREQLFKRKAPAAELRSVQFSAVTPKQTEKGSYTTIQIAMYEEQARGIVEQMLRQADGPAKETLGSSRNVADNTAVTVTLSSEDLSFRETETQIWQGRFLNFTYCPEVPKDYGKDQILFTAAVYFNDVIATRLRFTVSCAQQADRRLEVMREDVTSAFMSYASKDRQYVAALIMGMKKARPDLDIFFDVENLRSGEHWEAALRREIEKRDTLFLCWSQNAKESKWVDMEWHHALQSKGLDAIEPIPLVSPAECPPPEELSCKHFNDKYLLYLQGR